jgi:predicted ArsR family transcriptional regulator
MSIFDILKKTNIFPRVRDADSLTSAQSADEAAKFSAQHGEIIVQALVAYGSMGKDQIAEATYLDGNQVARRMKELETLGLVQLTGRTVKNKSGRQEREWAATMCA